MKRKARQETNSEPSDEWLLQSFSSPGRSTFLLGGKQTKVEKKLAKTYLTSNSDANQNSSGGGLEFSKDYEGDEAVKIENEKMEKSQISANSPSKKQIHKFQDGNASKKSKTEEEEFEEPVWRKRFTLAILFILLLGGLIKASAGWFMNIFHSFQRIPIDNTELLKDVMFGGEPWIIGCTGGPFGTLSANLKLHRSLLSHYGKLGMIKCSDNVTPARTFATRFSIPDTAIGIVVANQVKPVILYENHFTDMKSLKAFIERNTRPVFIKIFSAKQFSDKCVLNRIPCMIVSNEGPVSEDYIKRHFIEPYKSNRKQNVVLLDKKRFKVILGKELLKTRKQQVNKEESSTTPNIVCVAKQFGDHLDRYKPVLFGRFYDGSLHDADALKRFFIDCQAANQGNYLDRGFITLLQPPRCYSVDQQGGSPSYANGTPSEFPSNDPMVNSFEMSEDTE